MRTRTPWRIDVIAAMPYMIPHELCHYAAARALGLRARLRRDRVYVEHPRADWRAVTVGLAPAAVGVLASAALLLALAPRVGLLAWALVLLLNILWQGACVHDFNACMHILRHRRFPDEDTSDEQEQNEDGAS